MKMNILNVLVLSVAFLPISTFGEDNLDNILEKKSEVQSTKPTQKKRNRRRKVHMCNDCGKPETQCECAGHGDNKEKKEK